MHARRRSGQQLCLGIQGKSRTEARLPVITKRDSEMNSVDRLELFFFRKVTRVNDCETDLDLRLVDRLGNGFGLRRKYRLEVDFAC